MDPIDSADKLASFLTSNGSKRFNIFVGSTISCSPPATTPSVSDILQSLFDELLEALPEDTDLRRRADVRLDAAAQKRLEKMPFESLWERVSRVTGSKFVAATLKDLCSGGVPNFHHEAIAWLVKHGHVQAVITTNYDEFVEQALTTDDQDALEFRGFGERDPMVVELVPSGSFPSNGFRCIKLHGTLSMAQTLAFMFPQITAGFSSDTGRQLQELLTSAPTLFAGYGCNDWDLRRVLRAPIEAVWVTRRDNWNSVDERCRCLAEYHRSIRWYQSNLRTGRPQDSVFVQLASLFGCPASWVSVVDADKARSYPIVSELDRAKKLAILAEVLDSLALRVAADIFEEAARVDQCVRNQSRLEVGAYVAMSHDMSIPEKYLELGEQLIRREGSSPTERAAVLCQLAFIHLIGGSKLRGVLATFRLIWRVRHLEKEARARGLLQRDATEWSADDRLLATTLAKAREVFAHNILRLAWFHVPGHLGIGIRVIRALGVRRLLAVWARRVLQANRQWVASIGDLVSIGNLERESAHASCLTGRFDDAIEQSLTAEEALEWGRWYQWQANAIRTRGWLWLHIGGRFSRLQRYADREAERSFKRAVELSSDFVGPQGEMIDDRIKALLELKRLTALHGDTFEWEEQLEDDLTAIADRNPQAHRRYLAMSERPPRTREPLG